MFPSKKIDENFVNDRFIEGISLKEHPPKKVDPIVTEESIVELDEDVLADIIKKLPQDNVKNIFERFGESKIIKWLREGIIYEKKPGTYGML